MNILISAFMLLAICYNFGGHNYYDGKWIGFLGASLAFLGLSVSRKFGWLAAITLCYFLFSPLKMILHPAASIAQLSQGNLTLLQYEALDSALKLILILLPFLLFNPSQRNLESFGSSLACFFVLVSLGQVFWEAIRHGCAGENTCGGALGNPSLNAGMLVCCLPIVFKYAYPMVRWEAALAVLVACVLGKSNIGLGMLAVFILMRIISTRRIMLIAIIPVLAALGWYFLGTKFLSNGDRFEMWQFFMSKWWMKPMSRVFGMGFGTFIVYAAALQEIFNMRPNFAWIWMHNDWLESIFTNGLLGGLLLLAVYVKALIGLVKKQLFHVANSLGLFGVYMGCNFPLHVGITAAFGAWLVTLGLTKDGDYGMARYYKAGR